MRSGKRAGYGDGCTTRKELNPGGCRDIDMMGDLDCVGDVGDAGDETMILAFVKNYALGGMAYFCVWSSAD